MWIAVERTVSASAWQRMQGKQLANVTGVSEASSPPLFRETHLRENGTCSQKGAAVAIQENASPHSLKKSTFMERIERHNRDKTTVHN